MTRTRSIRDHREDFADRKSHYGAARQPWDDIVEQGWAPFFAAGNVVKYMRRDKEKVHSLESARWYYARLYDLAAGQYGDRDRLTANSCIDRLERLLVTEELKVLRGN